MTRSDRRSVRVGNPLDRRTFLQAAASVWIGALARLDAGAPPVPAPDLWREAGPILNRIVPPSFPGRVFDITGFGARPEGQFDSTPAFRAAIAACHSAGGGRVVAPKGRFLTGPIVLQLICARV